MLTRRTGYLTVRDEADADIPAASHELQREGFTVLPQVFTPTEVGALAAEISAVFDTVDPDVRSARVAEGHFEPFRYEMLNRSALAQEAIAHPAILSVIEPLLGEDCHVIANTAWRQPPDDNRHGGRFWHLDAGPHIPRPAGVVWDERIPYPIFAVACHIFLIDCPIESGPTGVIPGSHTSGQAPPRDRLGDDTLTWNGVGPVPIVARAGDVSLFVSDAWHRRLPSRDGDPGRFFLQVHYGRRDLAQRLRTTDRANHLSEEAIARATTPRKRTLIGLHEPRFYDG
jgi:ectoine hydroxylase-related dioxygenase (phytanoyl-CoA dioxygenase family)